MIRSSMNRLILAALPACLLCGCIFQSQQMTAPIGGPENIIRAVILSIPIVGPEVHQEIHVPMLPYHDPSSPDTLADNMEDVWHIRPYTAAVTIVSVNRYRIRYRITDSGRTRTYALGETDFGYRGELKNTRRYVPKGIDGTLLWPIETVAPFLANEYLEAGIYFWQLEFSFDNPDLDFVYELPFYISEWPWIDGAVYRNK